MKRAVAALMMVGTLLLTGCSGTSDSSSSDGGSQSESEQQGIGSFSITYGSSQNSLQYSAVQSDGGVLPSEAKVKIEVPSMWTVENQPMSGTVYPNLPAGNFTVTVSAQNPDGSVTKEDAEISIAKSDVTWTVEKPSIPISGGELTVTLTGTPKMSGTVDAYLSDDGVEYNNKVGSGTITNSSDDPTTAPTNTVTIKMPPSPKDGNYTTESVKFKYSGDSSNEAGKFTQRVSWQD